MTEPGSDAAEGSSDDGSPERAESGSTADDTAPTTSVAADESGSGPGAGSAPDGPDIEDIRAAVEARYDFEDFSPADMDRMTPEEWEAVFDPDSWITGSDLLDRIEADLKDRVRRRNMFAVVEREARDGEDTILAYTDTGYVVIRSDGRVVGEGSILREVEPIVALCAMDEYDPPSMPAADEPLLPHPDEVTSGSSELGNRIMLFVAGIQLLAGLLLVLAPVLIDPVIRGLCSPAPATRGFACSVGPLQGTLVPPGRSVVLTTVVGLGFLAIGGLLFVLVANARLSDRFRAQEYRDRLRAIGVGTDDRPAFLPPDGTLPSAEESSRPGPGSQPDDGRSTAAETDGQSPADPPPESRYEPPDLGGR